MTPSPPPIMILIIPVILNTISTPQTWAPMARAPEIVYRTGDEPQDIGLRSGSSAGSNVWLPPMDLCSDHFGIANTANSSVFLLLLVSIPVKGDEILGSKMEANRSAPPWNSLPLEPGTYGAPPHTRAESVLSYPFLSNMSLDVGLFSLSNSSLLSSMMQNSILEVVDRRLDGEFDERQQKRVLVTGLWCAHPDQSQRPSIAQAMDVLRREDAQLPEPGPAMRNTDAVRSLEERAYGELSGEDEYSPAETEYHTSE